MPASLFQSMFMARGLDISNQNKNLLFTQHTFDRNVHTYDIRVHFLTFHIIPSTFLNQIQLERSTEPKYIHCSLFTAHII